MVDTLESLFPGLRVSAYQVTSPPIRVYNCIAWAAGDTGRWWWPTDDPENEALFWPAGVAVEESIAAFVAAFSTLGYIPCDHEMLETGFEKVALFATAEGEPTHAARQLAGGRWTSKLGFLEDVEHELSALGGALYGAVVQILRRPVTVK